MKLSTQQIQQQPIKAMLEQQEALYKVQQQLATGKSILQPSDDPSGTARANQLRDAMGRTDQYVINGDTAEARLTQEESIFGSMVNSMQRVRELSIQSLSDTYSAKDRMAIGSEIEQFFQEFMGLVNTQTSSGEYLFGGYQSDTEPFSHSYDISLELNSQDNIGDSVATTSAAVGTNGVIADTLVFGGDVGARITIDDNEEASSIADKINLDTALATAGITATATNSVTLTVPNSVQVSATDFSFWINGHEVPVPAADALAEVPPLVVFDPIDFTDPAIDLNTLAAAIVQAELLADPLTTLTATVSGSDIIIENTTGDDIRIEDVQDGLPANTDGIVMVNGVSLDELGAQTSNDSISIGGTVEFLSADSIDYSITTTHSKNVMRSNFTQTKELVLDYNGDSGQRDIKIGDNVKIKMNDAGDELFVNLPSAADSSVDKSIFNMLYDFMSELKAGVRPSDDILTDIDTAMDQIEMTRAAVGSRLNMIDRQRMINEDYGVFAQQNISRIEDLDMAEAISILEQQLLSMQVLQQTYTRITSLSMFNYM